MVTISYFDGKVETYKSLSEASVKTGINLSTLSAWTTGKNDGYIKHGIKGFDRTSGTTIVVEYAKLKEQVKTEVINELRSELRELVKTDIIRELSQDR